MEKLACRTTELLILATNALNNLMSGEHLLPSADERKSALQQLILTVQAAANLTEVLHAKVVGDAWRGMPGGVERVMMETERIKAETVKVGKDVQKSLTETGRLRAEAEKVKRETNRTKAEVERAVQGTERLKAEAMM
ncbi:hypothetical protein P167DRAFT_580668, partial [Morchella conica CCBAS932]